MGWEMTKICSFKKKAGCAAFFFYIFLTVPVKGQEKAVEFYPTLGITLRAGIMNFFNLQIIQPESFTRPYPSERNIDGFSLNPGFAIDFYSLEVEYFSNLRYDVVHYIRGSENEYARAFLLDHNFNLSFRKKLSYGVGISIVNSGKGYWYIDNTINPIPKYHDIEFSTINFFLSIPVWKILKLEVKALYMPNGYGYNRSEEYIMYSLRLYHKFNFLNKKSSQ
jgi:hypothetical protein